jgi:hypothetical protein
MTVTAVEAKLAKLKREARREWRRRSTAIRSTLSRDNLSSLAREIALTLLKVAAIVALPIVVLVRASVYAYLHLLPTWPALAGGASLTLLVVAVYAAWLSRRFTGRARFTAMTKWVAVPLVAGWCAYTLLFLASVHAKTDEVRGYYGALHPILRVALSTVILADGRLVVTDVSRVPQDYARMGLRPNDGTLHYRQRDGWVHAVDLRTRGRSGLENLAVRAYFWVMGFDTVRHVGTADHLHIELPLR